MKTNFLQLTRKHLAGFSKTIIVIVLLVLALLPQVTVQAVGSLASYKDTLSTSRPSVFTAITGSVSVGANVVNVTSTNGLALGDTITLCSNAICASSETKIIANIPSISQITLTAVTTGSYTSSGFVWYKSTPTHTISFTAHSNVTAGKFNIYLPADASPNDGFSTTSPATVGFDFNKITLSTTTDITMTVAGNTATTTTVSTSTSGSNIVFTVNFTGTIASSTAVTITIGAGSNKLLAPTKTATAGTADTYSIETDELDGSSVLIDSTTGKVATIESVAVSATVAPSLTFTINAVSQGSSVTGISTDAASTATTVPFGVLTVNATTTVAQYIHIDTNSTSGYNVTAQQDGSLRKTNGTTIVDFNSGAFADNEGTVGFGYALQNKTNTPVTAANTYNNSGAKFNSIGFSSTTPATIMSSTGPANGDEAYVAYRVKVNATQAQGIYQNLITYIATPVY